MILKPSKLKDTLFNKIHQSYLIYNACWEDPQCDRHLLEIQPDSRIVMITSAGCNALDYLLDDPREINAIDVNPRQNALLDFKLALFRYGDFEYLYKFFGEGVYDQCQSFYNYYLKPYMGDYSQKFWDKKISYFNGRGWKKSFYFNGTAGVLARLILSYLNFRPSLYQQIKEFLTADSLEEQQERYEELEPRIFSKPVKWMLNRHSTMSLAGVPRAQQELIIKKYEDEGIAGYIMDCFRQVFCQIPIRDNYFYYVYLNGKYSEDCCPSYLKEQNFDTIRSRADRINLHTTSMSQYLKENPGVYSHYVLLDHQDWLAAHNVPALVEEWELILENSEPGTKILMRSAANEIDFFPEFVLDRVHFERDKTEELHAQDRVGTYGSVYLGIVK